MKKIDLYISNREPKVSSSAAWLKPVDGGVALYVMDGGWKPLKLVDDKNTHSEKDDTVEQTVSAVKAELIGSVQDTSSDLTLNGLKKYIDEQLAG